MRDKLAEFSRSWGVEATFLEATTSTNDMAREMCSREGDVVVAECQSAGRGQRGNRWTSPSGENLMFSLMLTPSFLPAGEQFYISKVISLSVVHALEEVGVKASVKWPNDIYVGDKKIAGILIENDITGDSISRCIVGVGINVNQKAFDQSLPNPTSVVIAAGIERYDRVELLALFYKHLIRYYDMLAHGDADSIDSDYLGNLYLLGKEHIFTEAGGRRYTGIIRGVRPEGELEIADTEGRVHSYLFQEVAY